MGIEAISNTNLLEIHIDGQAYNVPADITVLHAIEYAGYKIIRGCGCRGGVCGACATVYRLKGDSTLRTCLACQTIVQDGMQLSLFRYFPVARHAYKLDALRPDMSMVMEIYPDIVKCMGCNTCTKSCPMDIPVMKGISRILQGDIKAVADWTISCVMCGLCAGRCPAELSPYLYFLLCRRMYGKMILPPFIDVPIRIDEIRRQKYTAELDELMTMNTEQLKKIYSEYQADKQAI